MVRDGAMRLLTMRVSQAAAPQHQILSLDSHRRRDRETRSRRFSFVPKHILLRATPTASAAPKRKADTSCTFGARSNSTTTLATEMRAFPESKRGCFICVLIHETRSAQQSEY